MDHLSGACGTRGPCDFNLVSGLGPAATDDPGPRDHQDYYERRCREYHERTFFIDPAPFLGPLTRYLPPPARLLDVGCGSGRDLLWFKRRGYLPVGLERSAGLAALAREFSGCEVIEADFECFDFSSFSFDAVTLIGVLVHVPKLRFEAVLAEIIAAVRPGGLLLVTLKEGVAATRRTGERVFELWLDSELTDRFRRLDLVLLERRRTVSRLGTGEFWLSYVLRREGDRGGRA